MFATALRVPFAEVTLGIVIAQLDCFVLARGCARRHGGAAHGSVGQKYIGFNGRIAARVQNLAAEDLHDFHLFILGDYRQNCPIGGGGGGLWEVGCGMWEVGVIRYRIMASARRGGVNSAKMMMLGRTLTNIHLAGFCAVVLCGCTRNNQLMIRPVDGFLTYCSPPGGMHRMNAA